MGEEHPRAEGDTDEEHLATPTLEAISLNPPRAEPHSKYLNNFGVLFFHPDNFVRLRSIKATPTLMRLPALEQLSCETTRFSKSYIIANKHEYFI